MVEVDKSKVLKCSNCFAVFYDNRNLLRSAGTTPDGTEYYNTECPRCGSYDRMSNDYVGVPDDVLERYDNQEITFQEAMDKKTEEQKETDNDNAKHYSNF